MCSTGGADLPACSSSVWFVQTQSHDLHDQPQRSQKKVSRCGRSFFQRRAQVPEGVHAHLYLLSLTLKLSARSRSPDGLIVLLTDARQADFVALKLTGGKLLLSADLGRGPASISSPVSVSDGQWHTVSP